MSKKTNRNKLINNSFCLLFGFAILVSFVIVINILVNLVILLAKDLPTEEPLPSLIRQFQSIDIVPIAVVTIITFILSLLVLRKYKSMVHIVSICDIVITLLLALDLSLLFAKIIPIEEEIMMHSSCCAYLDSQPSPWFWVTIVLSVIVISLSSALLTNTILEYRNNRAILRVNH